MNWFKCNDSPIIVIGMHRSGTTMFTKVLEESGVFMGADLSINEESYTFTHFNEKLLNDSGGTWNEPICVDQDCSLEFNTTDFLSQFLHYKRKPLNVIRFLTGRKWGWKDPRNTYTLLYWVEKYFPNAKFVHVYRNGIDVAKSLSVRNETLEGIERVERFKNEIECFKLWENYVGQAFSMQDRLGENLIHVSYEDILKQEKSCIEKIEEFLNLKNLEQSIHKIAQKPAKLTETNSNDDIQQVISNSHLMKELGYI